MKNRRLYILGFVFIFLIMHSCTPKIYDKSKLTLANKPFNKSDIKFRTDGYYYLIKVYEIGENKSHENKYGQTKTCAIMPIIFYDDGSVLKSEFISGLRPFKTEEDKKKSIKQSLKELEEDIEQNTFHVQTENSIWNWGLYTQSKNDIIIQYYYNYYGDYRLINYKGEVKNDSTIIFNSKEGYAKFPSHVKSISENNVEVYHFKKFHTKPDSTNYIRTNIKEFGQ